MNRSNDLPGSPDRSTQLLTISAADLDRRTAVSFAQRRLWYIDRLGGTAATAYRRCACLRLSGNLDLPALHRALNRVIARHEALRTTFAESEGEAIQHLIPETSVTFQLLERDVRLHPEPRAERDRLIVEALAQPTDLVRGPLAHALLVRETHIDFTLALIVHRIAADSVSMEVILDELAALYGSSLRDSDDSLPHPATQHSDYAAWQRHVVSGERLLQLEKFWKTALEGAPTLLELSGDLTRQSIQSHEARRVTVIVSSETTSHLRTLSNRHQVPLSTTLLAGWGALISKLTGQQDLLIGLRAPNRERPEVERAVGPFENMLPLRISSDSTCTAAQLVAGLNRAVADALAHRDLAFEQILDVAQPPRRLSHHPLVQATFDYRQAPCETGRAWPELVVCASTSPVASTVVDLELSVEESGDVLRADLLFAADLFGRDMADRIAARFVRLLEHMAADDSQVLEQLELLSHSERKQVLDDFNQTAAPYPREAVIPNLFRQQVERDPNAVAVVHAGTSVSYGELNRRANRLAHWLITLGVGPDTRVAIYAERGLDLIVAMLGVVKAGGAYVPLDTAAPENRLAFMLEDSLPVALLTQTALAAKLQGWAGGVPHTLFLDSVETLAHQPDSDPAVTELTCQSLANVIYTSGSTGQPKGVMVEHRGIARLVINNNCAPFTPVDCMAQCANPAFDASTWEVWGALLNGSRILVIPEATVLDADRFNRTLSEGGATAMLLPSGLFNAYADRLPDGFTGMSYLLVGGDVVDPRAIARLLNSGHRPKHVLNAYGPTEATVIATIYEIDSVSADARSIPIGQPITNTQVYVLDAHRHPVPPGVTGEIYIAGDGVARGYLNRPELTTERFVINPFAKRDGARMYETGDLGRWLADGRIEYVGRSDFQVKVRGFRIELGEIEARLAQYPGIREAAVLARGDGPGDKQIVAYYVAEPAQQNAAAPHFESGRMRQFLAGLLPEYMVPAAYVRLETMPLTPNGKLDRRALPAPDAQAYSVRPYEPPQGEAEITLARIWAEVLKIERVGRFDQFFELGGNSLAAIALVERVSQAGLKIDARAVFTTPTLADLASRLGTSDDQIEVPPNLIPAGCTAITPAMLTLVSLEQAEIARITAGVPGGDANIQDIYPLAPLQEGILFHHLMATDGDPYLLSRATSFDSRSRLDAYLKALQVVVDRHDILRTSIFWEYLPAPVQVVWRHVSVPVEEVTLTCTQTPALEQLYEQVDPRRVRLDMSQAPLLRVTVAHDTTQDRWLLLMLIQHMICDDATLVVMQEEIRALLAGGADALPPPVPFRNVIAQARLGISQAEHEAFFRKMLGDVEEPTAPFGLMEAQGDGTGIEESLTKIEAGLAQRVRAQARKLGLSVASICHLAFALVVARTSGRDDIVFGTTLFGRMHGGEGTGRTMGLSMNTLPIRIKIGDEDVVTSVRKTQALLADLLRHEHAALALAQSCSAVPAPAPLFTALFNYRHARLAEDGHATQPEGNRDGIGELQGEERTNYPFFVAIDDLGDGFKIKAQTRPPIEARRICRFMQTALEQLTAALEQSPQTLMNHVDVLPHEERIQVLDSWNQTVAEYPHELCIHELFEAQVQRTPDSVAALEEGHELTYRELNSRANRLAHYLTGMGVRPDDRVAIYAGRGLSMMIGLLGVLKAGAAYVPLDPAFPADRLAYMLRDSRPAVVLTQRCLEDFWRGALSEAAGPTPVLYLTGADLPWESERDDNLSREITGVSSDHLAYVIYTSGSTGKPKGVMVRHQGVVNLLTSMRELLGIGPRDRFLSVTTFAFDIAALEFYLPLICGACTVLVDRSTAADPAALEKAIVSSRATMMQATPATWRMLVESGWQGAREMTALCGGEALPGELAARLCERIGQVWNVYGPTETTIWSTAAHLQANSKQPRPVTESIGRPIANTRIYVLDPAGRPVPSGVAGEIYIGGDGVARGYHERPELNAERFVRDPFVADPTARMYKTGDLGRWAVDGTLDYLRRNDFQVKLRGFRIELGEIEAQLKTHRAVRDAVVLAREDKAGDPRLVAYVVPQSKVDTHEPLPPQTQPPLGFSLFFFGADTYAADNKYQLYMDAARFADAHEFEAVWTPERHFHHVGSLYPNPSVLSAALAAITKKVHLRAGSVVLPMHNPIRVAEEWAVVDNLSNGRIGMALATGWHARDFVLAPENFTRRKRVLQEGIRALKDLWSGKTVPFMDGAGALSEIQVFPRPLQAELPLWITAAGNADTFVHAGEIGANVLTHLLGQTVEQAAENIALYRRTREKFGHDPAAGRVTMMIHTYLGADREQALTRARLPFMNYMRAHLGLLAPMLKSMNLSVDSLSEQDLESIVEFAFDRYSTSAALIGTPQSCLPLIARLAAAEVDEIACLIDWMEPGEALAGLDTLRELRDHVRSSPPMDIQSLKRHCRRELPEYMVPSAYIQMESFPLTPNGKLDRKALPAPNVESYVTRQYEAPQSDLEAKIAAIWGELLNMQQVGRQDHFFELGGNSLLAVQCISRLRKLTRHEVKLNILFSQPVLGEFSSRLVAA